MNIETEDREIQTSDECLESSTGKAKAAEEESGDILDTACQGRTNRTCGH